MAKFRCNGLIVVAIFDLHEKITIDEIWHETTVYDGTILFRKATWYKVGTFIEPDGFDSNMDKICTTGIHYFLTPKAAICYNFIQAWIIDDDKIYDANGTLIETHYDPIPIAPIAPIVTIPPSPPQCGWSFPIPPISLQHGWSFPMIIVLNNNEKCKPSKKLKPKLFKNYKSPHLTKIHQPVMRKSKQRYIGCVKK
jgi:hypothetical protein